MRMRLVASLIAALAATGVSPTARAQDAAKPAPPREPLRRTLLLEPSLGFKAPLGWGGLSINVVPTRPLVLHAGVGVGFRGLQGGAGARGRIRVGQRASFGLGLGWSIARYAGADAGFVFVPVAVSKSAPIWWWSPAHFVSGEFTLEYDAKIFVVRPFSGLSFLVNAGDAVRANDRCVGDCDRGIPIRARLYPYGGLAFAFGIL